MKNLNFLKLFLATIFVTTTALFAGCVDDNDDTEAPRLEISPKTLVFNDEGFPVDGSQDYFEISANRKWTATVVDDKTWVTLSKMEGNGSDKVQVSIPEGITDEATVMIQISNKVGVLLTEKVTIRSGNVVPKVVIYNETFGSAAPKSKPENGDWPNPTNYTDFVKTGEGSANVSYEGVEATFRKSGILSEEYENASGETKVFFGSSASFTIKNIALKENQTNLKLTFGGNYASRGSDGNYDNDFKQNLFHVALSNNGTTWKEVSYEFKKAGSAWVIATADFTLAHATPNLYIKFTADAASVFSIDDPTLYTGNGGQEINLGDGTIPEPTKTTIADLNKLMPSGDGEQLLDATYYFEAVVQNDVTGGNYSFNNLILAAENETEAGNGITVYDNSKPESLVEPSKHNLDIGDRVKVTLHQGLAKVKNYKGMHELVGTGNWITIEKLEGKAAITPVIITADKLIDYQGMAITISNIQNPNPGVWATANNLSTHNFNSSGTDFVVFCKKEATAFVDKTFKAVSESGVSISGLAAVNNNTGQLVPRNLNDTQELNADIPFIVSVSPTSLSFPAEGGEKTIDVTVLNKGNGTLSVEGVDDVTVNDNQITVKVGKNETASPIEKTLTISIADGNSITVDVTIAAPISGDTFDVTLTSDEIASMTSTGYAPFQFNNSFGTWSGKCGITSTDKVGEAPYLQINFESTETKGAFNSHIKTPELNGIVQKIVITTSIKTVAKRYFLICDSDYEYAAGITQSDLDKAAKAKSEKSTEKGATFTFDNLGDLNLSQFSIFPGGGAVYISSITITCKKK